MHARSETHGARWRRPACTALLALALLGTAAAPALAAPGETTAVSVDGDGAPAAGFSAIPALTADGRYVAFHSYSPRLVSGDTNSNGDIFVRDRVTGVTARVSVDGAGREGPGESVFPAISADGRSVAFQSSSHGLAPGDPAAGWDIFVRDRQAGTTERVPGVGGAGPDADLFGPTLSADGRFVAFWSSASNLVAGDTNGQSDVFVYDRETGATERVSVDDGGNEVRRPSSYASISADGRYVAFGSDANDLVAGDTDQFTDVFVRDRETGTTELVSAGATAQGFSFSPAISADGRYVAFLSDAQLVPGAPGLQVYVRDRATGATELVSTTPAGTGGSNSSFDPQISADGSLVTFSSYASDLVAGDTNDAQDVFVRDRAAGVTERVSVTSAGVEADGGSSWPSLAAESGVVAFTSQATNLVPGAVGVYEVYVHELGADAAPAVMLTAPAAGAGVSGTTTVAADASDDRAVAGVQFLLDGEPLGAEDTETPYSIEWDAAAVTDGPHVLGASARDSAGNTATAETVTVTVAHDVAAPVVTFDAAPPAVSDDPTPAFAFSADEAATFECALAPGADAFAPCESPVTAAPLADGAYTFSVRATDDAGNTGAAADHAFRVDATAPAAPSAPALAGDSNTGLSSTDAETADTTPTFVGTAEPGATVILLVDGAERGRAAAFDAGAYAVTADELALGTHVVTVRAQDAAGNVGDQSASRSLRIVTATACNTATNRLAGSRLANTIAGTSLADVILGYAGADTLAGAGAADCLAGGDGDDRLRGDDGDDELIGAAGGDRIDGGAGRDVIRGRVGDDEIAAVDGVADVVECGPGLDVVEADRIDKLTGCERVTRR